MEADELMRLVKAAIRSRRQVQELGGQGRDAAAIEREPEPGVVVRFGDADVASTLFAPAAQRPEGYPEDAPFVADKLVSVTVMADTLGVNWFLAGDADELLAHLAIASQQEGWQREPDAPTSNDQIAIAHFRRGEWQRSITSLSAGVLRMVTLTQRKRPPE